MKKPVVSDLAAFVVAALFKAGVPLLPIAAGIGLAALVNLYRARRAHSQ